MSTVQIDTELQTLAQNPTNPALVQRLADLIRQDQSQQILKAVQAHLISATDEQVVGSYIGALSIAATAEAQDVLIDSVLTATPISDTLKAQALTELADLKHPYAAGVPSNINLTWNPSAGASYYLVCIDTTTDLLCNGLGDNTNLTRVNGTS